MISLYIIKQVFYKLIIILTHNFFHISQNNFFKKYVFTTATKASKLETKIFINDSYVEKQCRDLRLCPHLHFLIALGSLLRHKVRRASCMYTTTRHLSNVIRRRFPKEGPTDSFYMLICNSQNMIFIR